MDGVGVDVFCERIVELGPLDWIDDDICEFPIISEVGVGVSLGVAGTGAGVLDDVGN